MTRNPDTYLLYEYMKKNAFTVRLKVNLKEPVDEELLTAAAREAIGRFPYFSVSVGLDEGENYVLNHNDRPIVVLPEQNERLVLGSEQVGGHLFAITWRNNSIWFNWAHCLCGAFGAMFWVKTTLYQYLTKKHGDMAAPKDLKAVGTEVDEAEYAYPDPDDLPYDTPLKRYNDGDSNVGIEVDYRYFLNPFVKQVYYYQVELNSKEFMKYAKKIDGSPNSILAAIMLKTSSRYFAKWKGHQISAKIADDYRKDLGCPKSYRDFVRFIHVKYDWEDIDDSIEKLNMRARGAIISQMQPENSFEWYRNMCETRRSIDDQPDLKSKIKYAKNHSIYGSDYRDTYMVSYVGNTDWGGMAEHIDSVFTITDGNLMLEVNALPNKLCVSYQLLTKDRKPLDYFCEILDSLNIPYKVSERMVRYMPDLQLPKPENDSDPN